MPVKITLTNDPVHIDSLLKLRHKVFSEEESLFNPTPDGRVIDRFDAYNTTSNLVVLEGSEVVGGLRLNTDSQIGLPADDYYNFRSHLPEKHTLLSCSMFCVTEPYRHHHIALSLMLMATYFGVSCNVTHVIAPINPPIAKLLTRIGFKTLTEETLKTPSGLGFLPVILDVKNLTDFFYTFAENNRLYNFLKSYTCFFYKKGEYIIRAGELGYSAFVIIEGEAEVINPDTGEILAVVTQGEVVGELALLTDDIRTADVVAKSDLRIMSMAKTEFMEHLMKNPEHAMQMLKSIGNRMKKILNTGS
jgi:N-acyl-L-homoserine lactone synthetase